jgi:O-antigen/teichoic acid export membrane protein
VTTSREAAPPGGIAQGLKRRALSLGAANAFEYAIQFLLPVVLVRCLDEHAFGQYRLLWLVAGTALAVVTQSMAASLFYYLPRSDPPAKRMYISQAMLFLLGAGLVGAWAVSGWNPWRPQSLQALQDYEGIVPAFLALWILASLLDLLPTIEERVAWQARATIGLATLRAVVLALTAYITGEFGPVLVMTLVFVVFKVAVLLGYVARFHGLGGPYVGRAAFADQVKRAAPFTAAGALYGLRAQADQWVAAAVLSLGMFAAFSVAAVLAPMVNIFRQSVIQAFLPSMSRLQAAGDLPGMVELNSRANATVGALVFPILAFAFVFAEEIVTLVYTQTYIAAASVMRVYILGLVALSIELVTVMVLLRQGPFAIRVNLIALPISVAVSIAMADRIGIAGAAVGSVSAVFVDVALTLRRIAHCTGLPVRRLQDWRGLARSLACAVVSAALAGAIVAQHLAAKPTLLRAAVGGLLCAATYLALALTFTDRARLFPAQQPGTHP